MSLFGVLANLLYHTVENLAYNFRKTEIYVQIAKIFYTPFCVCIIYLCYNKIQSSGEIYNIQYSVYSISVSFLLGFFSGRMIDLLNRLKDILLPLGKGDPQNEAVLIDDDAVTPPLILEAIKKNGDVWRSKYPNILGISLEKKYIKGKQRNQYAILFEVSKKDPSIKEGLIPETISYTDENNVQVEIPTDVKEVGAITSNAALSNVIQPGYVSRKIAIFSGTIGLILNKHDNQK
ncbi:MAG: hypothetical protein IPQ03_09260 [Bacteroidetes bacterium]|nr:hypothetical protein [Bacteroidota bacterium]